MVAFTRASSVVAGPWNLPNSSVANQQVVKMHITLLTTTTLLAVAAGMPSYIAVPADQIAFVDLRNLHARRVPRQTLSPPPPPVQLPQSLYNQDYQPVPLQYQQQALALAPPEPENSRLVRVQHQDTSGAASLGASAQYNERPPDFGEYVDFGAHTGDNGAFGWYADYPINNHEHDSSSHSGY